MQDDPRDAARGGVDGAPTGRRGMPFTRQVLLLQVAVVLGLGALVLGATTWLVRTTLVHQYEDRALAVARTVAAEPGLGDLVARDDSARVQRLALAEQHATGALFVVVTDDDGVRLAHPNPAEIGRRVSTDPSEALAGREVADTQKGTLGLSARGKVPLRDSAGAIVGEVSVGFASSAITTAQRGVLVVAVPALLAAVALAAFASAVLARRLKRLTFGLEPADVADLVREREAVLYGIREGALAVDQQGRVTMCNAEAERLLGGPVPQGTPLSEVPLPDRLRAAFESDDEGDVIAVSGARVLVATQRRVTLQGDDLGRVMTLRDRSELEALTSELAAVRTMTTALRAQRHETANRMHTLLGLLEGGSVQDALDYLRSSTDHAPATRLSATSAVASNTIRALVAAKTSQAVERGVALELSEESWVPQKIVAPVEVVTVLGNLVDNAIEAASASTHRPAAVTIDLLADDTALVVSVADTGDGIDPGGTDPGRVEAIFGEGVSSRGSGRGLGLAIARHTARGLGGDIVVTATGAGLDGGGTVFVATLPDVLAPQPAPVVPA